MIKNQPKTIPFSIRLTPAEKADLERRAGKRPVGVYARERLFGQVDRHSHLGQAKRRPTPNIDKKALAQALGLLGKSDRERSLRMIGEAARIGALPLTPDVLEHIERTCRDIGDMKTALMAALRIKEE
ncbi:hypothetical protein [Nisaea nitritireducens]|uniref:hypothetical protein n=1 Tax=Nisaea nitritireducens TaxID=568392 RepID=UPI001865CE19|nr:hypothetical protein [Nisaea nitritireducens]